MTEAELPSIEKPKRIHLDWVPGVLFRARTTFEKISAQKKGVWLTPLLLLTILTVARVLVAGSIRQAAALGGVPEMPPDFQYYSPADQAQIMQAMQATSSPVFIYVFPMIIALTGVWLGWLLVGGLLHLIFTLLGGRGDTGTAMNVVAWASIPFVLREGVRAVAMLSTRQEIQYPGLSGFVPAEATGWVAYAGQLLGLIDIYLIWHVALLILGVRAGQALSPARTTFGVLLTILLVLAVQALLTFLAGSLGSLTIIRPFF